MRGRKDACRSCLCLIVAAFWGWRTTSCEQKLCPGCQQAQGRLAMESMFRDSTLPA